jgi:hypothetical protein
MARLQTERSWRNLLFPDPPRAVPGERWWRTVIRTIHIASMAVLVGGHFFDLPAERLVGPLAWTLGSGVAFMLLELCGSLHWLFQARGLLTIVKIVLVALVPLFWAQRIWILLAVIVIGSVGSHMPSRFRYHCFLTGKSGSSRNG